MVSALALPPSHRRPAPGGARARHDSSSSSLPERWFAVPGSLAQVDGSGAVTLFTKSEAPPTLAEITRQQSSELGITPERLLAFSHPEHGSVLVDLDSSRVFSLSESNVLRHVTTFSGAAPFALPEIRNLRIVESPAAKVLPTHTGTPVQLDSSRRSTLVAAATLVLVSGGAFMLSQIDSRPTQSRLAGEAAKPENTQTDASKAALPSTSPSGDTAGESNSALAAPGSGPALVGPIEAPSLTNPSPSIVTDLGAEPGRAPVIPEPALSTATPNSDSLVMPPIEAARTAPEPSPVTLPAPENESPAGVTAGSPTAGRAVDSANPQAPVSPALPPEPLKMEDPEEAGPGAMPIPDLRPPVVEAKPASTSENHVPLTAKPASENPLGAAPWGEDLVIPKVTPANEVEEKREEETPVPSEKPSMAPAESENRRTVLTLGIELSGEMGDLFSEDGPSASAPIATVAGDSGAKTAPDSEPPSEPNGSHSVPQLASNEGEVTQDQRTAAVAKEKSQPSDLAIALPGWASDLFPTSSDAHQLATTGAHNLVALQGAFPFGHFGPQWESSFGPLFASWGSTPKKSSHLAVEVPAWAKDLFEPAQSDIAGKEEELSTPGPLGMR